MRSKKSGAALCRHYASWCIPLKRKVNAVNYAKLSMLHRISGGAPIAVYASNNQADLQKLYDYLQELCNGSKDLELTGNAIVTSNSFLAHHLENLVRTPNMVPVGDTSCCGNVSMCQ